MSHIATDVVLLPDATMTEKAIAANKALIGDDAGEITLGSGTCLPHISLAMGCIDEADVDAIGSLLQKLARKVPVRQLQVVGTVTSTNSRSGESPCPADAPRKRYGGAETVLSSRGERGDDL